MNPTLYKALIMLASNNKPASATKSAGRDGGLGNRTVLYADEPVDLPDWGIAALPAMILGAAPQSCLFVSDLTIEEPDDKTESSAGTPGNADTTPPVKVSFSLTVDSAPGDNSQLIQRQITWRLAMPVSTFRQITTSANSTPVRAPVIRTKLVLRNVVCDVELGLLEVPGITQPLLVGRDTLSDRFLIRPDHDKASSGQPSPSATLAPVPHDKPEPTTPSAPSASSDAESGPSANASPAAPPPDTSPHTSQDATDTDDTATPPPASDATTDDGKTKGDGQKAAATSATDISNNASSTAAPPPAT